jgi:hypothetical protein
MPTYNFLNEKGLIESHFMSYSDLDKFTKENPKLTRTLSTPSFISGVSTDSGRLPEGFKDRMRQLKKQNPLSKAVDHLI